MSFSMPIKKVVIVLFIQRPSQGWSWDTFLASFDYEVRENASFIYFKLFFMPIHFSHVVVLVCVGWSCSCPGHTSTSIWLRNNWNNKSSNIYWSSGKCLSGDYNLIFQGPIPSIKSSQFFYLLAEEGLWFWKAEDEIKEICLCTLKKNKQPRVWFACTV